MYDAMARVRFIAGLTVPISERGKITLNPLLAPSVLSSSTKSTGINLSQAGGYYGLFLAELSKAVSTENTPRSSLDLAKSLFNHAAALKALVSAGTINNTNPVPAAVTTFLASSDLLAIKTATSATVSNGNSTFLNTCKTLPDQDALVLNPLFANAFTLNNVTPSASDVAQMVLDLTFATDSKITKNLVSPFNETVPNGC